MLQYVSFIHKNVTQEIHEELHAAQQDVLLLDKNKIHLGVSEVVLGVNTTRLLKSRGLL